MASTRPGAKTALVPAGAVRVRLCRYSGLPDSGPDGLPNPRAHPAGFTLLAERLVGNRDLVERIAAALNAVKPIGGSGAINCPSDSGSAVIAVFGYPQGAQDPVSIGLSGCHALTNGHVSRLALEAGGVAQVASLTPVRSGFVDAHESRIHGIVRQCGGQAPGGCRPVRRQDGEIIKVMSPTGDETAEVEVSEGHFTAVVAPGEDRLEMVHGWDGRHPLLERHVRVRGGRTAQVHLVLEVK